MLFNLVEMLEEMENIIINIGEDDDVLDFGTEISEDVINFIKYSYFYVDVKTLMFSMMLCLYSLYSAQKESEIDGIKTVEKIEDEQIENKKQKQKEEKMKRGNKVIEFPNMN